MAPLPPLVTPLRQNDSVGRPLPGVQLRVLDAENESDLVRDMEVRLLAGLLDRAENLFARLSQGSRYQVSAPLLVLAGRCVAWGRERN